jgi:hypothetical protein
MVTIVTSHWKEDLTWLKECEFPVVLIDKEGADLTCFEPAWVIPNKGLEASVYLKFIIERYNDLPENVAFIHGHETAHHHKHSRPLLELIRNANTSKYDFISLNHWYRDYVFHDEPSYNVYFTQWWDVYTIPYKKPPVPGMMCFMFSNIPVGAQFIVSKERILANPLELYKKWYNLLMTRDNPKEAIFFEHMWYLIFGQRIYYQVPDDLFLLPLEPYVHWSSQN